MVYDITNEQSFDRLKNWRNHFMNMSSQENDSNPSFLVLGNKLDLADTGHRDVESEDAQKYC